MPREKRLLPPHGNCEALKSYRKAEIVYDLTHHFSARFLSRGDRTVDRRVQAARSGKQTIVEGSRASGTSKETELKPTNVARARLDELLKDWRDAFRVRRTACWDKESREAILVRRLGAKPNVTSEDFREFADTRPLEVVANIAVCQIDEANDLLDQQIRRLERDFKREGGLRERMTRARQKCRARSSVLSPLPHTAARIAFSVALGRSAAEARVSSGW